MEAFLHQIANSITKEKLPYLYTQCFIFPTKRAANYFTNFLNEIHKEENFILPTTITIQDFITSNSTFIIKDDWSLLLELYQIQNELTNSHQPLEKFLPWGKLILKDFDECDKYLVDATKLFSVLKAHKEIEDTFSITADTKKYVEQFIKTTSTKDKESIYKTAFLKTWSLLGEIYLLFQDRLRQHHFAYEGMAYREVLERLRNEQLKLPYTQISFCGFNALSVCEEEIFNTIAQKYKCEFWWDADEHFLNNKFHEAGNFLRNYRKKFNDENSHWIIDNELKKNKQIEIVGISSDVGQTQFVAQQLSDNTATNTAIVLCDEQLLSPLLYAYDVRNSNITMGYSIAQSELFLFVICLFDFYGNARISDTRIEFYHKDIANLMQHIYFKKEVTQANELSEILPLFGPYFPKNKLQQYFPINMLQTSTNASVIIQNVISIIEKIQVNDNYFYPIKEAIITQLQAFLLPLIDKNIEVSRDALSYVLKQFIGSVKVPFVNDKKSEEKDKKKYVQIMGFLETRILDFEELYILSLNDDNLPGTNKTNSFIPYNLRKGFGLPTFEQFDGINAYHFYRLLKRAKKIHLIYNNQIGDNASEKSRFIRQIQHDLDTEKNTVNESIASCVEENAQSISENNLLKIEKSDIMKSMLRERKFSPSALKVYIKCPVQFYLQYVVGVDEPQEMVEEIDAAIFGLILHKTLELIYLPYLNQTIDAKTIASFSIITFLQEKIKEACVALKLPKEITQGENKLQLKIIERIAQKIIQNDAAADTLHVLKTEGKFLWDKLALDDGTFATIQGTIDRLDKINEHAVRIVDYKTGKIELPTFQEDTKVDEFLDLLFIFQQKDYSAAFQGILYALMYYKLYNCTEIYVGFHHAKNMKEGIAYLNDGKPIPIDILLAFEKRLSQLISNLIYKEPYFIQSANENAYQYSAYANLLGID